MLKYGIDIKTPTTIPGQDGWTPILHPENNEIRRTWDTVQEMFDYLDRLKRSNASLETRVVQVDDPNATIYSL